MEFTFLNKPELLYEARLRSITFSSSVTAEELRSLLTSHSDTPTVDFAHSPLPVEADLQQIEKCLSLLSSLINTLQVNERHKEK